jgi:hypothetical protein
MANPDLAPGALAKPKKGTARMAHVDTRRATDLQETRNKRAAKARDGYRCRRPRCPHCKAPGVRYVMQAAHVFAGAKGMGGDPTLVRSEVRHFLTLCPPSHGEQERHVLHVVPLDQERLGDGDCEFFLSIDGDRVFEGIG